MESTSADYSAHVQTKHQAPAFAGHFAPSRLQPWPAILNSAFDQVENSM